MAKLSFPHRAGWQRFLSVLLVFPLLISCSALSLTYSTVDWILLWKLDSYFDLSASQKKPLTRQIKTLHTWHRHHELPRYIQFLNQTEQLWKDGLTQAELEIPVASVEHFRADLAKQAASLVPYFYPRSHPPKSIITRTWWIKSSNGFYPISDRNPEYVRKDASPQH